MTWQIQEAKNKFSEVIDTSISDGPQIISRRGKDTAVIISYADYKKFIAPDMNFKEFLLTAPKVDIDLQRDRTMAMRDVDFVS